MPPHNSPEALAPGGAKRKSNLGSIFRAHIDRDTKRHESHLHTRASRIRLYEIQQRRHDAGAKELVNCGVVEYLKGANDVLGSCILRLSVAAAQRRHHLSRAQRAVVVGRGFRRISRCCAVHHALRLRCAAAVACPSAAPRRAAGCTLGARSASARSGREAAERPRVAQMRRRSAEAARRDAGGRGQARAAARGERARATGSGGAHAEWNELYQRGRTTRCAAQRAHAYASRRLSHLGACTARWQAQKSREHRAHKRRPSSPRCACPFPRNLSQARVAGAQLRHGARGGEQDPAARAVHVRVTHTLRDRSLCL